MSLTTRCPACGTTFKVVPDQLRISDGWVRCGHCAEVFDAAAYLNNDHSDQPEPAPVPQAPAPAPPVPQAEAPAEPVIVKPPEAAPVPPARPAPEPESEPASSQPPASPARQPGPEPEPEPEREPEPAPTNPADLSFVRAAQRKAFWRRPLVRAMLLVVLLVLAAALAAQVAVQERDRLATLQPQWRPWLEKLCEPLACKVGPLRQIDAIVIDSSTFNKLRGDGYRLSFTLKNQSALPVAMPAIELTLTDNQDQPIVRRVLLPAELAAGSGVLAPSSEWSGGFALSVAGNGGGARVSGYRLLAFYP